MVYPFWKVQLTNVKDTFCGYNNNVNWLNFIYLNSFTIEYNVHNALNNIVIYDIWN
jgi:hypothetical protein